MMKSTRKPCDSKAHFHRDKFGELVTVWFCLAIRPTHETILTNPICWSISSLLKYFPHCVCVCNDFIDFFGFKHYSSVWPKYIEFCLQQIWKTIKTIIILKGKIGNYCFHIKMLHPFGYDSEYCLVHIEKLPWKSRMVARSSLLNYHLIVHYCLFSMSLPAPTLSWSYP